LLFSVFIRIFVNMTTTQITNLLNFTILFHKVSGDSSLMNCDMTYIWEKYQKMVGVDPIEITHLNTFPIKDAIELKMGWLGRWKSPISIKQESVLNYLCVINTINPTPDVIFDMFGKYIGDINNIESVEYGHLHPLFKEFMNEYQDGFRREINIEKLLKN